jgi:hypothetical protein
MTNVKVSAQNVAALAGDGGRDRWKIENEGFNAQKNGGYGLEHGYSNNLVSAKIFYRGYPFYSCSPLSLKSFSIWS